MMFGVMARAAAAGKETPPFSQEEKSSPSLGFFSAAGLENSPSCVRLHPATISLPVASNIYKMPERKVAELLAR